MSDLLGQSVGEILAESKRRNTYAKRERIPTSRQQQLQQQEQEEQQQQQVVALAKTAVGVSWWEGLRGRRSLGRKVSGGEGLRGGKVSGGEGLRGGREAKLPYVSHLTPSPVQH